MSKRNSGGNFRTGVENSGHEVPTRRLSGPKFSFNFGFVDKEETSFSSDRISVKMTGRYRADVHAGRVSAFVRDGQKAKS